jgi:hypothetical protein
MFARVYDNPEHGGRWVIGRGNRYAEPFHATDLTDLLALALQAFRVPVETHTEAKARVNRRGEGRRARARRRIEDEQRRGGLGHTCGYPLCDCPPNRRPGCRGGGA